MRKLCDIRNVALFEDVANKRKVAIVNLVNADMKQMTNVIWFIARIV